MIKDSNKFDVIAKLDHVTKAFGEVVAVSDASFSVENRKLLTLSNYEEIIVSYAIIIVSYAINGDASGGGGGGKSSDDYTISFGNDYLLIVLISIITLIVLKKRKFSFKKGLD